LPVVYAELRKLAAARMSAEAPGHTLDATALVNEAYLRLAGEQRFETRAHFFAAAAEAMRRILVEAARRKGADKRGGGWARVDLTDVAADPARGDDLLALDEALTQLAVEDPRAARVVTLRHFTGMTIEQAADAEGISVQTANRDWTFAKAWLKQKLRGASDPSEK
jgi:RNA polymerase sigma factor (TIGR02999 family)